MDLFSRVGLFSGDYGIYSTHPSHTAHTYTHTHKHTHTHTHTHTSTLILCFDSTHTVNSTFHGPKIYIPSLRDRFISTRQYNNNCERDSPTAEGMSLALVRIDCCVCSVSRERNGSFSLPRYFYHDASQPVNIDAVKVSSHWLFFFPFYD